MTIVQGNAELLEERASAESGLAALVRPIRNAAKRGSDLTHRLLSFGRRQMLQPKVIDLNMVVMEAGAMLRQPLGETIDLDIVAGEGVWHTLVDRGELESAILNLALNARDAMPQGGPMTIRSGNFVLGETDIAVHSDRKAGEYVTIAVTDTGPGMAAEVLEHVFEPFFTTKGMAEHSGLGLSMVHGFVNQSGGFVDIESEPGAGTTVRLYLPRAAAPTAPDDGRAETPMEPPRPRQKTVLIVEDDGQVLEVTAAMIGHLGYRTLTAKDGEEALALLDGGRDVDLLFTDVIMQGGMSGPELVGRARQRRPQLKALLFSGYDDTALEPHGVFSVDAKLLRKPYSKRDLARELHATLESGKRSRG